MTQRDVFDKDEVLKNFRTLRNRDWKALIWSVLISTLVWFFMALNKQYTTEISYPIRFTFEQANVVALEPPPPSIKLHVTGQGGSLLRKSLGIGLEPLVMKIKNPTRIKYMTAKALQPSLSANLTDLKINYILDDTIFFNYNHITMKDVVIRVDSTQIKLKKNCRITSNIQVVPNIVTLKGASELVENAPDTLDLVYPSYELKNSFTGRMQVKYPEHDLLVLDTERVSVRFQVTKYKERKRPISLITKHFPRDSSVYIQTPEVWVSYLVEDMVFASVRDTMALTADLWRFNEHDSTITPELFISVSEPYIDAKVIPQTLKVYVAKSKNWYYWRNRHR